MASPRLQQRSVVSSFIFRVPKNNAGNPDVALFRRSGQVSTYPHKLAPISGSVSRSDSSPLATAWREILEETTLTPSSLSLWRKGKPFVFRDVSVGREWTIHPFAFRLTGPEEGITTDWEHEGWGWHDPATVIDDDSFGGVPRLHESLRRVWFEGQMNERASQTLSAGLENLQTNRQSGSRELTTQAVGTFREIVAQTSDVIDGRWWEMIRMVAWHLWKSGRESMGISTINALLGILADMSHIVQEDNMSQDQKRERMLATVDLHLENRKGIAVKIQDSFVSYIQSHFLVSGQTQSKLTILTFSASSTIRDSILDAYASLDGIERLELRILESRPLFEGVSIASSLSSRYRSEFQSSPKSKKLDIKIYTDASAALAADGVDLVLLGADRISPTKGVSNKIGSVPAVLSAKHVSPNCKVLVFSELEKIEGWCRGIENEEIVEENDPMEVINGWRNDGVNGMKILEHSIIGPKETDGTNANAGVEVKNIYFEWVPLSLVDAFISEEGVLDARRIAEKSQAVGEKIGRYLEDL